MFLGVECKIIIYIQNIYKYYIIFFNKNKIYFKFYNNYIKFRYIYAYTLLLVNVSSIKMSIPAVYTDLEKFYLITLAFGMVIIYGYTIGSIIAMAKTVSGKKDVYLRQLD